LAQLEWVNKTEQSLLERQIEDLWTKYQSAKDAYASEVEGMLRAQAEWSEKEQDILKDHKDILLEANTRHLHVEQTAKDHLAKYTSAKQAAAERMERCLRLEEDLTSSRVAQSEVLQELLAEKMKRTEDDRERFEAHEKEVSDLKQVVQSRDKELDRIETTMRQLRQQQIVPLKEEVGRLRFEEARVIEERGQLQSECERLRSFGFCSPGKSPNGSWPPGKSSPYGDSFDVEDGTEACTGGTGRIKEPDGSTKSSKGSTPKEQNHLQATVARLSSDLEASDKRYEKLLVELDHLREELKSSKQVAEDDSNAMMESLRQEVMLLKVEREDLGASLNETAVDLQAMKEKAVVAEAELYALSKEFDSQQDLKERYQTLREECLSLCEENVKLQASLDSEKASFVA